MICSRSGCDRSVPAFVTSAIQTLAWLVAYRSMRRVESPKSLALASMICQLSVKTPSAPARNAGSSVPSTSASVFGITRYRGWLGPAANADRMASKYASARGFQKSRRACRDAVPAGPAHQPSGW